MSTRIYHPEILQQGQIITLSDEASHHLLVVLRFQVGDTCILFDGENTEYQVKISSIIKKKVQVLVMHREQVNRESPLKIHLAQGIAKGDRWIFSLQKAVELGVDAITPLWTQHVAYKWDKKVDDKKMDQWRAIIISACEQSGRTQIPHLYPMQQFPQFIEDHVSENKFILQPSHGKNWRELTWPDSKQLTVVIGPEGGFSDAEYQLALHRQYQGITLGPRVLRTETAVVSALTILQALHGDL